MSYTNYPGIASSSEYWENAHKDKNKDPRPLTGTHYDELDGYFNLKDYVKPNINVLEIGVGFGYVVQELKNKGCNVYAMDVSQTAIDNVAPYIIKGYTNETTKDMPSDFFDLAICFLVTQHLSDQTIITQFKEVIRSLKKDGVFIVQFAGSDIEGENNCKEDIMGIVGEHIHGHVTQLNGRMCRTVEYASELIENECGGKVFKISDIINWTHYKSWWFWLYINKK